MKQFIVLAAVLPLLLFFLLAYTEEQIVSTQIAAADDVIYAAKEMAKQKGCFSPEIQNWVKREICVRVQGIRESDIIIGSGTDVRPVVRPGLIRYQVSFPVRTFDAGALLGVKNRASGKYYVHDSVTTSEYVPGRQ